MKILILSPFFPYPLNQGGKIRIFNVIKHLSKSNSITLAAIVDNKHLLELEPLKQLCEDIILIERPFKWQDRFTFFYKQDPSCFIRFFSVEMQKELSQLIRQKRFDLIQIEFTMMWQYADIFNGIPTVLDAHNIEYQIVGQIKSDINKNPLRKFRYVVEESKLRTKEKQAWRECNLCFTVSEKERGVIVSYLGNSEKVITIPNGVDIERFEFIPKINLDKQLLFLGSMDYRPNLDSCIYFLKEVFPLIQSKIPNVKLDIVGRKFCKITDYKSIKGVEFHENVPDIIPYFRKADLLLVPLRYGAGTRIKILEAMAAGLPIITTSKGCEGIAVKNNLHIIIADDPLSFSKAVIKALTNADLKITLAKNARHLVEEEYSWQHVINSMENSIKSHLDLSSKLS